MDEVTSAPWFLWAATVVIGLPVATVVLTELHAHLVRRQNALSGPVGLLRTWILPIGALLVLLRQIPNDILSNDGGWVRVTATVFGFLVLMFALSSLNAALFLQAAEGSWRRRLPSIFVDLFRVILIGAGLALVFSWVWGTDVGGLFAALGVTTIALGFALQNAVGSIVSGLLLLFEQPFQLGDWLEFGGVRGRVVEVNWRSVHIDNGAGIQIVPNAQLAGGTFTNLSRPTPQHVEPVTSTFAEEDPPAAVIALLEEVASGLDHLRPGQRPRCRRVGAGTYSTGIPVASIADADPARAQFELRLWYAARRVDLRLNDADISQGESREDVVRHLQRFRHLLHIDDMDVEQLADDCDVLRYADGETALHTGRVPTMISYVVSGRVAMQVPQDNGAHQTVLTLEEGDCFGHTALTRTPTVFTAVARGELVVLSVPRDTLDGLVRASSQLTRDIGQQIESMRQTAADALGVKSSELNRTVNVVR